MLKRVAICGGGLSAELNSEIEGLGALLAYNRVLVLTGGRDEGAMLAASRGAASIPGAIVVGILPSIDGRDANPYVTLPICTGMGNARNAVLVQSADVVVAVGGEWGTLSEIALARKAGKPVIAYQQLMVQNAWPGVEVVDTLMALVAHLEQLLQLEFQPLPPTDTPTIDYFL